MEATRRGGLRARTCQTAVTNKRKESQRKPPLPDLRVAEVISRVLFFCHNILKAISKVYYYTGLPYPNELYWYEILYLIVYFSLVYVYFALGLHWFPF
jgi:hypothetical protein